MGRRSTRASAETAQARVAAKSSQSPRNQRAHRNRATRKRHGHSPQTRRRRRSHKPAPLQQFLPICNADRSVGAHLSGYILRRTNFDGLAGRNVQCEFRGSAGQSFGAFLIPGLHFKLFGDANDYVGKSLSGGTIAISAGASAAQRGAVLAGNTVLYGATSGKLFIA